MLPNRFPAADGYYRAIQRLFSVPKQLSGIIGDFSYSVGPGRVPLVAIQDGANVNRNDVALSQSLSTWNTVHDLIID